MLAPQKYQYKRLNVSYFLYILPDLLSIWVLYHKMTNVLFSSPAKTTNAGSHVRTLSGEPAKGIFYDFSGAFIFQILSHHHVSSLHFSRPLDLYHNFAVYSPKAFSRDQASESAIPCLIRLLTHLLTGSTCLSSPLLKAKLCCSPSLCPYGSIQVNRLT